MVELREIPAILMISTTKTPETVFWVEIHHETHFSCPGPLKKHRKSIGFIGVCAPGPPKHDFHPTGLKMGGNHTIFMKCGENHYIITKMGYFGSNPAKGGNTLPRILLNTILLQPSEESTRACDSNVFLFSHAEKWKSCFHGNCKQNHNSTWNSPKHTFAPKMTYENHRFRWCLRPPARQGPTFT